MTTDRRSPAWAYPSPVIQRPRPAPPTLIDLVAVVDAAPAVPESDLPQTLRSRTQARPTIDPNDLRSPPIFRDRGHR